MESHWLKTGGVVALLAIGVALWSLRTSSPESSSADRSVQDEHGAITTRPFAPGAGARNAPETDLVLRDHLAAESKAPPHAVARQLNEERSPELESNPEFQKLLEMDSARKMAMLQQDAEELRQVRQQLAGTKISRRVLEEALLDPNREVRLAALYEISAGMGTPSIELLAPVVESDPDPEVRLEALEIVAEIDSPSADAVIHRAVDDPDPQISEEAMDLVQDRAEQAF